MSKPRLRLPGKSYEKTVFCFVLFRLWSLFLTQTFTSFIFVWYSKPIVDEAAEAQKAKQAQEDKAADKAAQKAAQKAAKEAQKAAVDAAAAALAK